MIRRIRPIWPASSRVRAFTTTRAGGVSKGPYESLNLGASCGDEEAHVLENRDRFGLALPSDPGWLKQVHGTRVIDRESLGEEIPEADGVVCHQQNLACTILTADCLPVLMTDLEGTCVAAIHAGWRGLAAGILEAGARQLDAPPETLIAWLGPGISSQAYAVGEELQTAMIEAYPGCETTFTECTDGLYADLYAIARIALTGIGITRVFGGDYCTYSDHERFFSYRRDVNTGRMATTIWLLPEEDKVDQDD